MTGLAEYQFVVSIHRLEGFNNRQTYLWQNMISMDIANGFTISYQFINNIFCFTV